MLTQEYTVDDLQTPFFLYHRNHHFATKYDKQTITKVFVQIPMEIMELSLSFTKHKKPRLRHILLYLPFLVCKLQIFEYSHCQGPLISIRKHSKTAYISQYFSYKLIFMSFYVHYKYP